MPRTTMPETSYASGTSDGAAARRDDRRATSTDAWRAFGDREALVDVADRPALDLRRAGRRRSSAWPAACWRAASRRATGSGSGRRTAPSGSSCSTPPRGSARSSSTSTRPTAPTSWLRARPVGRVGMLVAAPRSRPATTAAMVEEVRPRTARRCGDVVYIGDGRLGRAARRRRAVERERRWPSAPALSLRRPDQHPVHLAARPASRRARRCRTTTSSTTASSSASCAATPRQDRVCMPVPFYHCFGMVMGNLGAPRHGACMVIPAPAFDPAATLQAVQDERCTSLYGVPDDVHRRTRHCPTSRRTTCPRCGPASWPARRARSR